jgi:predicted transcriptional regulator
MAVSVRMDPLLEIELQQAADRQGVSKSQFIIQAVERALGRKNPYELMQALKAEEPRAKYAVTQAPYDPAAAKAALRKKLKAKHDAGGTR